MKKKHIVISIILMALGYVLLMCGVMLLICIGMPTIFIPIIVVGALLFVAAIVYLLLQKSFAQKAEIKRQEAEREAKRLHAERERRSQEKELNRLAEEKEANQRNRQAISIYQKCKEKGVEYINSGEHKKALKIIASNYGVKDLSEAEKLFELGRQLTLEKAREESERENEKCRAEDKQQYDKEFALTKVVGKSKYTSVSQSAAIEFKDKLVDEFDTEEKFKLLEFSDMRYETTRGNNLNFHCLIRVKEQPKILDSRAYLDGTLKVTAYDGNGNEVACGYISGMGYSETDFIHAVGFPEIAAQFGCICLKRSTETAQSGKTMGDKYTFKITPVNLWFVEK